MKLESSMSSIGSVWRKWDLQVHTPASILNNEFGQDWDYYVQVLFRKAIENNISAIGITDYFTIDGYKIIKNEYLNNLSKLQELFDEDEIPIIQTIAVFPNIEFRLNKFVMGKKVNSRINFHVILSNELTCDEIEENFLHDLTFVYEGHPNEKDEKKKLKTNNLIELGSKLRKEHANFKDYTDLYTGMMNAVVDDSDICEILKGNKKFEAKYILALPSDEDLSQVSFDGQDHQARKVLIQKSNCLMSSNANTISWGTGGKSESVESFINEFNSLKPSIWGSDAHTYDELFVKNKDRYLWIKADLTFDGLRQILNEHNRVFIGVEPQSKINQELKPYLYIDKLKINKVQGGLLNEIWFDEIEVDLNPGLVAIIGNKGGGKSALADIIGLCGNTRNHKHFSFLSDRRFRKAPERKANNFQASLTWKNNDFITLPLSQIPNETQAEQIKYLPQSFLDKLCLGEEEKESFEHELRKIIFSRLPSEDKLQKNTLDEVISFKTEIIRQNYELAKSDLSILNEAICELEDQRQDDYRQKFTNELHTLKQKSAKILEKNPINPRDGQDTKVVDITITNTINKLREDIATVEENIKTGIQRKDNLALEIENLSKTKQFFETLEINVNRQIETQLNVLTAHELIANNIINISFKHEPITSLIASKSHDLVTLKENLSDKVLPDDISFSLEDLTYLNNDNLLIQKSYRERYLIKLQDELGKPEREYQTYLTLKQEWDNEVSTVNDEISKVNEVLQYIDNILPNLTVSKYEERIKIVKTLFYYKCQIVEVYKKLYEPITKFKDSYQSRLHDYKIDFDASFKLKGFFERFDQFINYAKAGSFFSKDAGFKRISSIVESVDTNSEESILYLISSFVEALHNDLREGQNNAKRTVKSQLRQGQTAAELYDFIFELDYLDPMFQLKLADKEMTSLSPGERGALLLIFYLILDNEEIPLVIDQPEENLDNQSIYSILVPFIKEAKQRRQVIIVTHNPNLAVVCDADQIVYVKIDKNDSYRMSCLTGSIENIALNRKIIEVLEGTFPAFDTRNQRYEITRNWIRRYDSSSEIVS